MSIQVRELVETPIPNIDKISYTMEHRLALRFLLDTLIQESPFYDELDERLFIHDLDKCLFLALGGDRKGASALHRDSAPHHMEGNPSPNKGDILEAILDYESAGYTKPDKPLNAYDTVIVWGKPHADELIAAMEELGIASSYENTPNDVEWVQWHGNWQVTEDDILDALQDFCDSEPEWAAEIVEQVLGQ